MMMNRFFILLVALVLFSFGSNAQEIYKVKADKLNVRESKDPTSKKVGAVIQNDSVTVLDSADAKYFKIKTANGEGFVSKEYLQRISFTPVKQAEATAPIVVAKATKDNSNIIFISMVAVIMIALLFIIFKFVNNKIFMTISAAIVLVVAYFCYLTFLVEKTVAGKFTNIEDTQYQSFNFKSKDSVVIEDRYADSLFTAHYVIEGDVIKFKQQENTFLLLIRDHRTLVGEGFTKGIFNKN